MASAAQQKVADNMVVEVHYTLTDGKGEVLDSSKDVDPLTYLHGGHNIVPGLEREMTGRGMGDTFQVTVAPEDGYGIRNDVGLQGVPRDQFPDGAELLEGMQLGLQNEEGDMIPAWIVGVADDMVTIDLNHPLAGVTLVFDIEVVGIRAASEEELAHGHPHGPGGHHHH
jgi:FKBP-type peptidyl-prolyl cis-trans isomerase SlyD